MINQCLRRIFTCWTHTQYITQFILPYFCNLSLYKFSVEKKQEEKENKWKYIDNRLLIFLLIFRNEKQQHCLHFKYQITSIFSLTHYKLYESDQVCHFLTSDPCEVAVSCMRCKKARNRKPRNHGWVDWPSWCHHICLY